MGRNKIRFNIRTYIRSNTVVTRIRWAGREISISAGAAWDGSLWDAERQCALHNKQYEHNGRIFTSAEVNRKIGCLKDAILDAFEYFDYKKVVPDREQLKNEIIDKFSSDMDSARERKIVAGLTGGYVSGKRKSVQTENRGFYYWFDIFMKEGREYNHWTQSTLKRNGTLIGHLKVFDPRQRLTLDDLDEEWMKKFQAYLTRCGLRNVTVEKYFVILRWFLRWCYNRKSPLIDNRSIINFRPSTRDVDHKEIVFLTWDEFRALVDFEVPENKHYLQRVKDLFVFACTTGLRYSDVAALTRDKIDGDLITLVTTKTSDVLKIHLNSYSRAVLRRYEGIDFPGNRALPIISNQKCNDYLKELGLLAGIDSPVTIAYKVGNRKTAEIRKKYEVLSFHAGRRTYVSLALKLGATPEEVSRISGHHSYAVMRRYMGQDEEQRRHATAVFDEKTERETIYGELDSMGIEELKRMLAEYKKGK